MRNYQQNPLKKGEIPEKEEIIQKYIQQNLKTFTCCKHFNVGIDRFRSWLKIFRIKKDRKLVKAQMDRDSIEKNGYAVGGGNTKEKRKQTMLERYGVENISQSSEFRQKINKAIKEAYPNSVEKRKETCLEKYGVEYCTQSETIKEKIKQTNLKKYGKEHASQSPVIKEKIKETNFKKYGNWHSLIQEGQQARAQTNKERYVTENVFASEYGKEKIKQTNLEKYDVEYSASAKNVREKIKETKLEKYGVECNFSIDYDMRSQTWIEKYGVDNPAKSPILRVKGLQTCLEKYGVEYFTQTEEYKKICEENKEHRIKACYETKKRNNSFHTSKPEEKCYKILKTKFTEVLRQYRSEQYPFACDFFIPSLDLYIECNFSWTHGGRPFINDEKCLEYLNFLEEKAKTSEYYSNVIHTWTNLDVRKRETAKENNLNWLEFFTFNDFMIWFECIVKGVTK